MGLGSVGLGIGATAVTLHAYSVSGVAPRASIHLGPLHGSVMTTTSSVSTGQLVLVALIWAVIAVINIAYARRQPPPALTAAVSPSRARPQVHGCGWQSQRLQRCRC